MFQTKWKKTGRIKVLDEVKQKNLKVDQLTTDRHLKSINTSENRKRVSIINLMSGILVDLKKPNF